MKKIGIFVLLIMILGGIKMGSTYAFTREACVNTNYVTPLKQCYQDMQQQVDQTQITDIQTSNNNGICDNTQKRQNQFDYVDDNNDGVCDHYQNKDQCLNNIDCQTQRQQTRHHGGNHH